MRGGGSGAGRRGHGWGRGLLVRFADTELCCQLSCTASSLHHVKSRRVHLCVAVFALRGAMDERGLCTPPVAMLSPNAPVAYRYRFRAGRQSR